MNTQVKEAARQILGDVSDIQTIMGNSCGVGNKLSSIRQKAAFLYERGDSMEKIISWYRHDTHMALSMLGDAITRYHSASGHDNDAALININRLAEIVIQRSNVYLDRKARAIKEGSDVC